MKILLFANTDWYLYNFRLSLAKAIQKQGVEVVMVSPPGDYGKRLQQEGFKWIALPMERRSLNPFSEMKTIMHLAGIYRREKPDLVHHFTIKSVVYGAIAAKLSGVSSQVNAVTGLGHVFISEKMLAKVLRPMVSLLLRYSLNAVKGRLILQNNDDRLLFLGNRLIADNLIRIIRGSGVNTEKFKPLSRPQLSERNPRVLLATRLLWEKGIAEYIEAAKLVKTKDRHTEFWLGGAADSGNPASVSEDDIDAWQSEGIIKPLGYVDNIAEIMEQVDIVVLPSYREGTPKVLLEAAACGLPIVTTDVPGCREIIEDKVNGYMVPARDPVALGEAIYRLLQSAEDRAQMGQEGRRKVLEEFDENIVIKKTLDVYAELLPNLPVAQQA